MERSDSPSLVHAARRTCPGLASDPRRTRVPCRGHLRTHHGVKAHGAPGRDGVAEGRTPWRMAGLVALGKNQGGPAKPSALKLGTWVGAAFLALTMHASAQGADLAWAHRETWRLLSEATEDGWLSPEGAQAIQDHLSLNGWPVAVEEARNISGLAELEQSWLMDTGFWREWVNRGSPEHRRAGPSATWAWTSERRYSTGMMTPHREWRSAVAGWRCRVVQRDSVRVSGSWSQSKDGWTLAVGDHTVGWGHGLTVPRAQGHGMALFLGRSVVMLPLAPRGVIHSDFQGGLRGVAAEHHGAEWDGGVTAGSGHVGGMLRWRRSLQELSVTGFWNRTSRSCGVDWSGRRGPWDMQSALALTSEGVSWRTSTRWAHGRSFVMQVSGTAQFEEGEARGQMQGFATWVQPQSGAMVQMRVRCLEQGEWDLRLKGRPSKHHPWTWSLHNASHHTSGGLHVRMSWGQASWWVGRASGQWAQARHLQLRGKTTSRTNVPHTWSWGGTVMDGQGVVGAYALVPRLDGRMWSPLPKSGTRMGIWVSRGAGRMRWTVHATWAPS